MRFQITDDFLNEYSSDDLMYSIDERFVDGLIEGRVVTWQEYIIFGIFAVCLFGSVFTFFKFFTLRGCLEGLRDCFKGKDGGYKVKRSGKKERAHDGLMATI